MRRKGFTLVELLVVIAIIALLMGILMPALARVRQLAFRMTCGTNLSGIGKAMLIYSNDYDDELPKAGGRQNTWSNQIPAWDGITRRQAFGTGTSTSNTPAPKAPFCPPPDSWRIFNGRPYLRSNVPSPP